VETKDWIRECEEGAKLALRKIHKVMESVDTSQIEITDANSLYKLSNSYAAILKGWEGIERATRDRGSLLVQLTDELKSTMRRLLDSEPELVQRIHKVIDQAQAQLLLEKGDVSSHKE
jgi:hypothetical protein